MAVLENPTGGTNKLNYPTDYHISLLNLYTSKQGTSVVNLIPFLVELNLYEDIYGNTVSGQLLMSDALGLVSNFSLSGNEFIQVKLQKTESDQFALTRNFRVYKISNRSPSDSNNYEMYTLNFVSEEFLLSEQYRISKSYKSKKISEIITDILKNYLKVGVGKKKPIAISETSGTYDFILPNKKLFETINWLSTYALPKSGEGADMLFFENSDGYWFKSLQELYTQPVYRTYKFDPKNISGQTLDTQLSNVHKFEILNLFDTLSAVKNGTFSNRVITIDPLQRKVTTTDFDYDKYYGKAKKINNYPLTNNYKNRLDKTLYDKPPADLNHGTLRFATTNSEQKKNPAFAAKPTALASDIFIEKFMPNRVAQVALANYVRIKITVAGDPLITVGRIVDFETLKDNPSTSFATSKDAPMRVRDPMLSGKYLVTAVRHILRNNSYITVLELCKDSFEEQLSSFDTGNSTLKGLANGEQI